MAEQPLKCLNVMGSVRNRTNGGYFIDATSHWVGATIAHVVEEDIRFLGEEGGIIFQFLIGFISH